MGRDRGCVNGHPAVGMIHLTATSPLATNHSELQVWRRRRSFEDDFGRIALRFEYIVGRVFFLLFRPLKDPILVHASRKETYASNDFAPHSTSCASHLRVRLLRTIQSTEFRCQGD